MRSVVSCLLVLALLSSAWSSVVAQSPGTADEDVGTHEAVSREEAVSRVLASDPRFADLRDYEDVQREVSANFRPDAYLMSGYYRVLGPTLSEFEDFLVTLRTSLGWLIETNLVAECSPVAEDPPPWPDPPWPDPCAWRHTWVYRVGPDGTMTLLFDEGDPEPMPGTPGMTSG